MNSEPILHELSSPDPEVRRRAAEVFLTEPISEEELRILTSLLSDEDKGVRDAVGVVLSFNDNKNISGMVLPLISSSDISIRNLAGDILLKRGAEIIPDVLEYLGKCNEDDQKFLVDILGLIGDSTPEQRIIGILKETRNENVMLACVEALGNLRCESSLQGLIEVYKQNELYGPTVVEALGKIGSPAACRFIMDNYSSASELTQFSILESLGELGNEETYYFLLNEFHKSEIPATWAIVLSLMKLKGKYQLDLPYDEHTKNRILSTLIDGEQSYRVAASSLIVEFKDEDVLRACLSIYGSNWEIDANILPYLCQNGDATLRLILENLEIRQENLRSLLELLKNFLIEWNSTSIGKLRETEVVNLCDVLLNHLSNPDEEARKLVMELLFMIRPEMALVFFDKMADDSVIWNKLRLIELIEQYAPSELQKYLEVFEKDPNEMIRERVQWALKSGNSNSEVSK